MNDLSDIEADLAIANARIAELEKTIKKQESIIFGLNVVIEFLRKKIMEAPHENNS